MQVPRAEGFGQHHAPQLLFRDVGYQRRFRLSSEVKNAAQRRHGCNHVFDDPLHAHPVCDIRPAVPEGCTAAFGRGHNPSYAFVRLPPADQDEVASSLPQQPFGKHEPDPTGAPGDQIGPIGTYPRALICLNHTPVSRNQSDPVTNCYLVLRRIRQQQLRERCPRPIAAIRVEVDVRAA